MSKCKMCLYSKPGHYCKLTRRIPVSLGLIGCVVYIPDEVKMIDIDTATIEDISNALNFITELRDFLLYNSISRDIEHSVDPDNPVLKEQAVKARDMYEKFCKYFDQSYVSPKAD